MHHLVLSAFEQKSSQPPPPPPFFFFFFVCVCVCALNLLRMNQKQKGGGGGGGGGNCFCHTSAIHTGLPYWWLGNEWSRDVHPGERPLGAMTGTETREGAREGRGLWRRSLRPRGQLTLSGSRGHSREDGAGREGHWADVEHVLPGPTPDSKHWFTTSFLGGRCRKAMLGVWPRSCLLSLTQTTHEFAGSEWSFWKLTLCHLWVCIIMYMYVYVLACNGTSQLTHLDSLCPRTALYK